MNIFGMGSTELLVIILIMLIVAGPKRMIQWAYILGRYMGQLRVMWRQVMEQVQKEFDEAGVDIKLPKDIPNRREVYKFAKDAARPLTDPMEKAIREVENEAKQLESGYKKESQELDDGIKSDLKPTNGRPITSTSVLKKTPKPDVDTPPPTDNDFGTWSGTGKSREEE